MNTSKAPNHCWYFPFFRFSAKFIRFLLTGNDVTLSDVFDEKDETKRTTHIASLRDEFNLRNADPLFSYLPLPVDVADVLNKLWQRDLRNEQCDLYVSDFRFFWDGVEIGCSCCPKATWKFLRTVLKNQLSMVCCFLGTNEMFCNLIMPMLLLSSFVS
jgi:hypothetical protein